VVTVVKVTIQYTNGRVVEKEADQVKHFQGSGGITLDTVTCVNGGVKEVKREFVTLEDSLMVIAESL
jgi:hypothetical protein